MKNVAFYFLAVTAIICVLVAIFVHPVKNTGFKITEGETTSTKIYTYIIPESSTSQKTETQTKKKPLATTVKKTTTQTTTTTTTKKQSKLVSRLQEAAKKEREWLTLQEKTTVASITPAEFRRQGVIYYGGFKYTYYSEKVLPGPGLKIPGRHSDGNFVRDEKNYICVASSDMPKGTVVDTPFGKGKVYDTGCPSGVIDIYVSW